MTVVRSAAPGATERRLEFVDGGTVSVRQPIDAAWAAKSTRTSSWWRVSSSWLLNGTPPWFTCSRLMTAKPPLSHTITISLWPDSTELYRSLFIIRYEPSPTNAITSPLGAAPSSPPTPPLIS